jgi:putative transposase
MRINFPNQIFLVTNRCEEERFFLHPKPGINRLIGAWLAKALKEHGDGIEVYAFIFLSNHLHILLRDTKGQLAEFMWFFQLNLAKAVNRELGRRGHFFAQEYDAASVLTDEDFEARYAYIVTNAVKVGLVSRAESGPFFSSLKAALGDSRLKFIWFNRTKKHNQTRRGQKVEKKKFEQEYIMSLSIPPMWRGLTKRERRDRISGLTKANEVRYGRERRAQGLTVMGTRRLMSQSPFMRPRNSSRRRRVRVYCCYTEQAAAYLELLKQTVGAYREVYGVYVSAAREGRRLRGLEWPPGCYPPSSMVPVPLGA